MGDFKKVSDNFGDGGAHLDDELKDHLDAGVDEVYGYGPQTSVAVYDKVWTDSTRVEVEGNGSRLQYYTKEPFVTGTLTVLADGITVMSANITETATDGGFLFTDGTEPGAGVRVEARYQRARE